MTLYNWLPIKPKQLSISSIEEFLNFLSTINSDNYYFRGENTFYSTRTASAYRRLDSSGFSNSFINFENLLAEYYLEVGQMTNEAEKENFIAFSQHHQLKTPLLDVSTNPLIALYFATDNSFYDEKGDKGYIYLFDKNDCIDMSSFLRGMNSKNLLDQIIDFSNTEIISTLYFGMKNIYDSNSFGIGKYVYSLIYHCQHINERNHNHYDSSSQKDIFSEYYNIMDRFKIPSHTEEPEKYWNLLKENNNLEYSLFSCMPRDSKIKKEFDVFINNLQSILFPDNDLTLVSIIEKKVDICLPVASYLFMLIIHLNYLKYKLSAYDFHNLPSLPNMLYAPTHLFDRMRAQDGLFFYQLGMHKTESTYMSGSIENQQYLPDYIVEINDKLLVKDQLASFNISRKHVFPDFDNIAIDLFEKYKGYAINNTDNK